jgi:hypothetical protein
LQIGNAWLHANPIANLKMANVFANGHDDSGSLMAEYHRGVNHEWPDAAMLIVMHIAAANTDGMDLDLYIVFAKDFIKLTILDADFTGFF